MCFACNQPHTNRVLFAGILTFVDVPSCKSPSGARGHCVILTAAAAEQALPTLLGMAVAFKDGFAGHNARQKCGVITNAVLIDGAIQVCGYLFDHDYPEVAREIRLQSGKMGMSYELVDAHVQDMNAAIWTMTKVTFTGAAILLAEKGAYRTTSIRMMPVAIEAGEEKAGDLPFVFAE